MKNYIIYKHNNKIKRQAINIYDIYPIPKAQNKMPENAELIAWVIHGKTDKLKSSWVKHAWVTDYPNVYLWKEAQEFWKQEMLPQKLLV